MASATVRTRQSVDTVYNADSVEWCPVQPHQNVMLCGTYQLDEGAQSDKDGQQVRVGRLYSFRLEDSEENPQLKEVHQVDMPGILDIKWSYHRIGDKLVFGLVNSVGQLRVLSLEDDLSVALVTEIELGPDLLGLSLDWNNMTSARQETQITTSDSAGCVQIHQLGESSTQTLTSWKAHDFEAWITAFDQWNASTIYTGGDDCRLKAWDTRMDCSYPILNSKRHTMGVCSIQSNPVKEHILATGSYDEQLILWDSRNMKQPLSECKLGGGIWRIKWEPQTASQILTATMYNGFHIIDASLLTEPHISHHYTTHDSIGYGADWCRAGQSAGDPQTGASQHVIATCSFYDHLLTLWTYCNEKIS